VRTEGLRAWPRRAFGSVRLRITLAATIVFGVAFGIAAVVLVDSVRSSLENDVRHDGAVTVAGVTRQLEAGETPDHLSLSGHPPSVFVEVRDGSGHIVFATNGPGLSAPPSLTPGGVGGGSVSGSITGDQFVTSRQVTTPHGSLTVVATSPLDSVRRSVDTLVGVLAIGAPLLVVAVGLVVWFLVGRALRPVDSIRSEVEAISHGTLHRRVPVPRSRDEIARLAGTMNEMLDRLDRSARRQREFVSDASHELRSPVASIRTTVEVALHHPELADWGAVVSDVRADNLRMQHVVEELLDLARIDEDAPTGTAPDAETIELADVVTTELDALDPGSVDVTVAARAAPVLARRSELRLVVRNLLSNACRHARRSVHVSVERDADRGVQLVVDDDGPGVPPVERDRVFDRFARLDEGRSRDEGGVGLGLAIVRAVAQRRGWTVEIADAPAGGARFTVTLPE
jgi:signal transduction histidine kinase